MGSRTNWLLLINAALGSFLAGTASRIFAVSLPTVARSLDTTIVGISWAVISFQISTISLSLVFGRIGDIYGRQKIFGLGFVVSAIGACLCGLSQNVFQLIGFRFLQGIGASMTQSQARALAMDSMPQESAGKAQGFMTTAFHSGVLVGPSIGGLIIDYVHWRAVFFFLLPIAAVGMTLTLLNLKRENRPRVLTAADTHTQTPIDYLGAVLLVLATVALIAIIDHRIMEILRFELRIVIILLFAGLFLGFLYREGTTASPILDLSLFRIRMFTLSGLSLLLVGDGWFCTALLPSGYPPSVPVVYGFFVYQCTGFYGDVVSPCRLGCGQGRPAASFDRGHSFPRGRQLSRWVLASGLALDLCRARLGVVGIGNGALLSTQSRGHDRLGSPKTPGRSYGGCICHVRSREHIWDIDGHLIAHRGVSLLQRRCVGNTDPRESCGVRERDEFHLLRGWNHGAGGDGMLGHARKTGNPILNRNYVNSPRLGSLACLVVSVFIVLASSQIVKAQKEIERN